MAGQPRIEKINQLKSDQMRQEISGADVVIGVDEASGHEFVVFGFSTLQAIVSSGQSLQGKLLKVPILQQTEELECLVAAVKVAKGYEDYSKVVAETKGLNN